MKIGILTQPFFDNFGGILQAYALQNFLERQFGHRVIVINRTYHPIMMQEYMLRCLSVAKCLILKLFCKRDDLQISDPFFYKYSVYKHAACNFIKGNIHVSRPLGDNGQLRNYVNQSNFDAIIVGSDQVWRADYSPNITNYFLDFLQEQSSVKRIAYAASFGTHHHPIPESLLSTCVNLAKRFDAISVREKGSVGFMEKIFGLTPQWVLDPTLLHTADFYRNLYKSQPPIKERYVVSYVLDESKVIDLFVQMVADTFRASVRKVSVGEKASSRYNIEEWLQMIDHSVCVVTDSFHASVFSIIFQKCFLCLGNKERGMERFHSLLEPLGLSDRLISAEEFSLPDTNINWKDVNERLEQMRISSRQFLAEALGC